jgi:asparagine synthase (glutamine-hydrolysing)
VGNNRLISEQSQLTLRTPYLDNDLVALMYRLESNPRRNKEISLRLVKDGNPALGRILTDRGLSCNGFFPISVLAHLLYEFLAKAEYAYDYGMPQWLSRIDYALRFMHLQNLFLGRHKFNHFRTWYRHELSNYVKDMLLDRRTLSRPYLDKRSVERVVEDHTKGRLNYTDEITQLLTIELIQRLLIEKDN